MTTARGDCKVLDDRLSRLSPMVSQGTSRAKERHRHKPVTGVANCTVRLKVLKGEMRLN
jgi:hypothetical protein